MYKAYKFRLYPNDKQKELMHKTFGCVRLIYNHFFNECKTNGYQKSYDMCNKLKELSKEYPFLKEVDRDINASINIILEGMNLHYQS